MNNVPICIEVPPPITAATEQTPPPPHVFCHQLIPLYLPPSWDADDDINQQPPPQPPLLPHRCSIRLYHNQKYQHQHNKMDCLRGLSNVAHIHYHHHYYHTNRHGGGTGGEDTVMNRDDERIKEAKHQTDEMGEMGVVSPRGGVGAVVVVGSLLTSYDAIYAHSVHLVGFDTVSHIGDFFGCMCISITSLDLSPLRNVTTIGDSFLCGCRRLRSCCCDHPHHLEGEETEEGAVGNVYVTHQPRNHHTPSLSNPCDCRFDLTPLRNVTSIGHHFLSGCTSLVCINLDPLDRGTSIGNHFLGGCRAIQCTLLHLNALASVASIGSNNGTFLDGCDELSEIDLSSISNLIVRNAVIDTQGCFGVHGDDLVLEF